MARLDVRRAAPDRLVWRRHFDEPNTGLCVAAAGAALLLMAFGWRRTGALFGVVIAGVAVATLFEWTSGVALGIDTLFTFDRQWGRRGLSS